MILVVACGSLGAGPWRCGLLAALEARPGLDRGVGSGSGSGLATLRGLPTLPGGEVGPGGEPGSGGEPSRRSIPPAPPPPPVPKPTQPAAPPAAPPIATAPRRDEPTVREPLTPARPGRPPRAPIPDRVVMTAVRALQPTFVACWKRAQRNDPTLVSARVRISLELDAAGAVTSAQTDAEDLRLGRCLASVARRLTFPAVGHPAALEIPLYF